MCKLAGGRHARLRRVTEVTGAGPAVGHAPRMARSWGVLALIGAIGIGCGDDDVTTDAGLDAGRDGGAMDAGLDAGEDDAGLDAGEEEAGVDSGTDSGTDASFDSGVMSCAIATIPFTGPIPQALEIDQRDPPDLGCVGTSASGPDRTYAFVASLGAGTYRVTVTPFADTVDPMIYVLESCDATECLEGTMLNGVGEAESVEMVLEADQIVYVVVDSEPGNAGGPVQILGEKL